MSRLFVILLILLAGCSLQPEGTPPPYEDAGAAHCLGLYRAVDREVATHGGAVHAWWPVPGYPHLRLSRFLASFSHAPLTDQQLGSWVERLRRRDMEARRIELGSLPPERRRMLAQQFSLTIPLLRQLETCGRELARQDLRQPARIAQLRERADVPSDYRPAWRMAGLYPLTRLPMAAGIRRYQQATYFTFIRPLDQLPVNGRLQRFGPRPGGSLSRAGIARVLQRSADNPLRIPEPGDAALATLFATFAPIWEIDLLTDQDRPGAPYWQRSGIPSVDPGRPQVYHYLSYSRWRQQILLQLNYVIWFAGRPATGPLDPYAGALDGITWRVTLAGDGRPLLYDSIHNCGCYHMFFPHQPLTLTAAAAAEAEPPLVPQWVPAPRSGERLVIRVASGSHYLQRIYRAPAQPVDQHYRLARYAALYRIPVAGDGRRSLFGADAIVAGSQRLERWLFWPMGIPSAGAMRERGHHATAFLGKRHFDDPLLLPRLFQPADP